MKRVYVTWDPEDGSTDKNADKKVPLHLVRIVETSSPKKAAVLAAVRMPVKSVHDTVVHVMLASQLGCYGAKVNKYDVIFSRRPTRVSRMDT